MAQGTRKILSEDAVGRVAQTGETESSFDSSSDERTDSRRESRSGRAKIGKGQLRRKMGHGVLDSSDLRGVIAELQAQVAGLRAEVAALKTKVAKAERAHSANVAPNSPAPGGAAPQKQEGTDPKSTAITVSATAPSSGTQANGQSATPASATTSAAGQGGGDGKHATQASSPQVQANGQSAVPANATARPDFNATQAPASKRGGLGTEIVSRIAKPESQTQTQSAQQQQTSQMPKAEQTKDEKHLELIKEVLKKAKEQLHNLPAGSKKERAQRDKLAKFISLLQKVAKEINLNDSEHKGQQLKVLSVNGPAPFDNGRQFFKRLEKIRGSNLNTSGLSSFTRRYMSPSGKIETVKIESLKEIKKVHQEPVVRSYNKTRKEYIERRKELLERLKKEGNATEGFLEKTEKLKKELREQIKKIEDGEPFASTAEYEKRINRLSSLVIIEDDSKESLIDEILESRSKMPTIPNLEGYMILSTKKDRNAERTGMETLMVDNFIFFEKGKQSHTKTKKLVKNIIKERSKKIAEKSNNRRDSSFLGRVVNSFLAKLRQRFGSTDADKGTQTENHEPKKKDRDQDAPYPLATAAVETQAGLSAPPPARSDLASGASALSSATEHSRAATPTPATQTHLGGVQQPVAAHSTAPLNSQEAPLNSQENQAPVPILGMSSAMQTRTPRQAPSPSGTPRSARSDGASVGR